MDKAQALHKLWSSFGVPAIDEFSAYDPEVMRQLGIGFPRITYEVISSNLGEPQTLTVSVWDRATSWTATERIAQRICAFIGWGGQVLPVDGGFIKVMLPQNSPSYRRVADTDDSIRRIIINVAVDFLTAT